MKRILAAAAVILGAAFALDAHARDLKFITVEVHPWAAVGASGKAEGVFPDLIAEFQRRTGHKISESYQPFSRLERELESGAHDCGIFIWNESRAAIVERGETLYDFVAGVVARRGVKLKTYDDLKPLTISVLRGLSIEPRFDGDAELKKDFDNDYFQGLRKISHGRVDAMAGMVATIRWSAAKSGVGEFLGEDMPLRVAPLVLQCSKQSKNLDLLPEFNKVVAAMREDGTLAAIFKKNYLH